MYSQSEDQNFGGLYVDAKLVRLHLKIMLVLIRMFNYEAMDDSCILNLAK